MERKYPLKFGHTYNSLDRIPQDEATRTEQLRRVLFDVEKDAREYGEPVSITVEKRDNISDITVVEFEE